jgi:hypothetical protein
LVGKLLFLRTFSDLGIAPAPALARMPVPWRGGNRNARLAALLRLPFFLVKETAMSNAFSTSRSRPLSRATPQSKARMHKHARKLPKTSRKLSDADSRWDGLARVMVCDPRVEVRCLADLKCLPEAFPPYRARTPAWRVQGMERTGLLTPLIIDSRDRIVAGVHNYEIAKRAGLKLVPVIRASRLSRREKQALKQSWKRALELHAWYGGKSSTAPSPSQ